jgi:iron complex transport system substrate-binding protein
MKTKTRFVLSVLSLVLVIAVLPTTAQESSECEDGFRLFDHEFLATEPVCIPENPERIVVAWPLGMVPFVRAGAPLVGSFAPQDALELFPEWEEEIASIIDTGTPTNPEVVLGLEPDLIMGPYFSFQDESRSNYPDSVVADEIWTSIAPTIVFDWQTTTWRETTELIFEAANLGDEFDALMQELDDRIAELGDLIGNPEEIELSIVNVGAGFISTYTQFAPGAMIAGMVGFSRPDAQLLPVSAEEYLADRDAFPEFITDGFRRISLEELNRVDGDFILISGFFANARNQDALDELTADPLWQTLDAVQAEQVYVSDVNFGGGDIGLMHSMLDELAQAFGVAEDFSPNPYVTKVAIPELEPEASEETSD